MKPILKWVGGKQSLLHEIFKYFPRKINHYHEPFVGGGSVLLHLLEKRKGGEIEVEGEVNAYDNNRFLIKFYIDVRDNIKILIKYISRLEEKYNKLDKKGQEDFYYQIRAEFNKYDAGIFTSSIFLFLNKTGFRGLYREGRNGFNVPFGNYKHFFMDKEHLYAVHCLIQGVSFHHCDFEIALKQIVEPSFVYLDPPYFPLNSTSFVDYTKTGFGLEKHLTLFKMISNVNFLMSNSYCDRVLNEFSNEKYEVNIIKSKRRINSKNPAETTREVLIRNI